MKTCCYKVCHMVRRAVRQASAVHGVQAGVLHEDGQLHEAGSDAGCLHGHEVRSGGGVQAGSGAGMLPGSAVLRSPEGVRSGRLLQLARAVRVADAFRQPAEGLV